MYTRKYSMENMLGKTEGSMKRGRLNLGCCDSPKEAIS